MRRIEHSILCHARYALEHATPAEVDWAEGRTGGPAGCFGDGKDAAYPFEKNPSLQRQFAILSAKGILTALLGRQQLETLFGGGTPMGEEHRSNFPERRKFARLRKEFVAKITRLTDPRSVQTGAVSRVAGEDEGRERQLIPEEVTGMNISLGGVGVETSEPYEAGSVLSLELLMPQPSGREGDEGVEVSRCLGLLYVRAEVIWCHQVADGKFGIGLRFVNLNERQFKALSSLIAEETE